jgi:hypothetical protein
MNETTMVVGGAVVLGLAGLAAWIVTSKGNTGKVAPTKTGPILTTMPVPAAGGVASGVIQQTPFQDQSGQALALELAAQRAENARRETERLEAIRQADIERFKGTIAAVENAQIQALAEIDRVSNDNGGLAEQIKIVESEITTDCYNKHHGEWFNGEQQCRDKNLPDASNPAVSWSGHARWVPIKAARVRTHEINLARLEEQFTGLKFDLKKKFDIDYVPIPTSLAAHAYAAAHPGR